MPVEKDLSILNVDDFGASADGSTDDLAAINAGLAVAESESRTLYFPPGDYVASGEVTVVAPARVQMHPEARLLADHNGIGMRLTGGHRRRFTWDLTIEKMIGTEWWSGSGDTTSIGLQLEGQSMQEYSLRIANFGQIGLYLAGAADNGFITSCNFSTPSLFDNFVNMKADSVAGSNTGFANECTFIGGKWSHSSLSLQPNGGSPSVGSRNIWIGPRNNGHVFLSPNLEGEACERAIYCEGFFNAWYHPRLEFSAPIEFVPPNGTRNLIHYGTFFNGVDDIRDDANPIVIDPNRHNSYKSIWGDTNWSAQIDGDGRAMRLTTAVAAATYPALEIARDQQTGDQSTGEVRLVLTHDGRLGQIDTGGTMRYLQQPTGPGAATWV